MKIAHLSDIHFFIPQISLKTLFSKTLLGTLNYWVNRKGKRNDFDVFALPNFLKDKDVTHVVISGDLTTTSNEDEYKLAASFIGQLKEKGFKLFIIPGNHDFYTKSSEKTQLFYHYIETPQGLKEHGISYSEFGEGYHCICLDTTLATPYWSSQGLFSKELEKKLSKLLDRIPKSQPLIVINHFPVFEGKRPKRHQMKRLEGLRALLEKHHNILLYLHGHTHKSEFSTGTPLMINSGSLTLTEGGSFHLMDLSSEFLSVQAYSHSEQGWHLKAKRSFPLQAPLKTAYEATGCALEKPKI